MIERLRGVGSGEGLSPVPVEEALEGIRRRHSRPEEVRAVHHLSGCEARPAAQAPPLHPRLVEELEARGMWPLYHHQGEAISRILGAGADGERRARGESVVVSTATASGKSLCFHLPVLDAVLREENAYALYLFPTKALSQDQNRSIAGWIESLGLQLEAGVYDGDTEPVMRRRLRRNGRIILTNPDMLHASILPHHGGWAGLFANLRYVIVDELHTLRGIFGSHVGNVLRRLRRIARHHGADPIFIGASATIANPGEHAERLIGLPVHVVDEDGAPRGDKEVVLWNPPLKTRDDGTRYRKGPASVAVRLLPELVRRDVKTICFGRTRNTVELILRYIRERAKGEVGREVAGRIEAYRSGYLPSERRKIEARLFSGELGGVVSTNALEMGIDIGELDACLVVGWPGSVSSFLQQIGRAGRRRRTSLAVLIAGQEPIDQYFVRHPEALFGSNPEHATIEWSNPYILVRHLVCAAYELPIGREDEDLFGEDLMPLLTLIGEEGRLAESGGRWHFVESGYPASEVKLRTATDENFTIYELGAEQIVGELDYVAAMLSLYEGAVYIHRTDTFLVEEMDWKNQLVKIRRTETGYYTQALCQKRVMVEELWQEQSRPGAATELAEVEVITRITGYKKVRFHTSENIGYGEIDLPPLRLDTVAHTVILSGETIRAAEKHGPDFLRSGMHGVARLLQQLTSIRAMCDPNDLDTFIDGERIYLYDLYPGGIGYSEVAFEKHEELIADVKEAVEACECPAGCPACVLPGSSRVETYMEPSILEYPYPKEATRFLIHRLLGIADYVPRLDGVPMATPEHAGEIEQPLDERTERKARKAIRRLGRGFSSEVG